jgi:hypothetical protein
MKRILMIAVVWLGSAGFCLAQDSSGELYGFYQRFMNFKVDTNIPGAPKIDQALNGGGFGYLQSLSNKVGIYFQLGFFGGAKLSEINIKPITEFQGLQFTKRTGRADFYGKAGVGFARYVIQAGGSDLDVAYKMAFQYGVGTELKLGNGLYLLLEGTGVSMGVPADVASYYLYGGVAEGRTGWNTGLMLTTGIAIRF